MEMVNIMVVVDKYSLFFMIGKTSENGNFLLFFPSKFDEGSTKNTAIVVIFRFCVKILDTGLEGYFMLGTVKN